MRLYFIILLSVLGLAVGFVAFMVVGIYSFGFTGPVSQTFVKAVPLPVASVGNEWLRLSTYWDNMESQKQYYETQDFSEYDREIDFESEQGQFQYKELQRVVLMRMVQQSFIRQIANDRGITISDEELQEIVRDELQEIGNKDQIVKNIDRYYGWDLLRFQERFVLPQLYQERLAAAAYDDDRVQNEARRRALDAYSKLERGSDFEKLAAAYSDDEVTKEKGGDLGTLRREKTAVGDGDFDDVLFSQLDSGEYSGVLPSSAGFHILKVDERVSELEVKARHMLFTFMSFDRWIIEETEDRRVRLLIGDFKWDHADFNLLFKDDRYNNLRELFYEENVDFKRLLELS